MKALDTNVLIRFLVRDDKRQSQVVYRRFRQAEAEKEVLFVPALVVLETIWVLESAYKVTRQEIIDALEMLLLMPILVFENQAAIRGFLTHALEDGTELSDLLIAHIARLAGAASVLTFDKKASRSDLFEFLHE